MCIPEGLPWECSSPVGDVYFSLSRHSFVNFIFCRCPCFPVAPYSVLGIQEGSPWECSSPISISDACLLEDLILKQGRTYRNRPVELKGLALGRQFCRRF